MLDFMLSHRFGRPCMAVFLVAASLLAAPAVHAADPDEIHWTIMGPTSVTLDWRGTSNTVRYGPTAAYGTTVVASTPNPVPLSSPGPFWEARIAGLMPNTVYHYSAGNGPDHVFRTPPPPQGPDFNVYVEGDIGSTQTYWRVGVVQSQIAADLPRFVLAVGDLTYGDDQGPAAVDQHFNDVMVWSQDAAYMPAWGNHDWAPGDSLDNYKGRFDLPNPRSSPGSSTGGGEDWYWFDYGNVRFIAYPEPWTGALSDWFPRADAIMDSAQADTTIDFIVTFGHRPAYSSGHHAGSGTLKEYLDALGSSHSKYVLNVNGHSHDYERSTPQSGVTHVTVGTGGATLEAEAGPCLWAGGCPPPSWSAFRAFHHGALRLRFAPDGIQGTAICGPAGGDAANPNDITCTQGSVMDAFAIGVPGDVAPQVSAPSSVNAQPGAMLTVRVTASDANGDSIQSLTADLTQLPAGNNAVFTAGPGNLSGTLTWTPAAAHANGTYLVTFGAANALAGTASTAIRVDPLGQNLIGNPSFESGTGGWSAYHGATIARVLGGHEGSSALRVSGPAPPITPDFGLNDSPNWIPNVPAAGTRYRFRAWVRSDSSAGDARLQVREFLGSVQQGARTLSPPAGLSSSWQMLEVEYVAVNAGATLDFQVIDQPSSAGETFDVDDVSIQVVPQDPLDAPAPAPGALAVRFAPNPMRASATIGFVLPHPGTVRAEIMDLQGRRVRTLANQRPLEPGSHTIHFDGRARDGGRLTPGLYFFRLWTAEGSGEARFLILE